LNSGRLIDTCDAVFRSHRELNDQNREDDNSEDRGRTIVKPIRELFANCLYGRNLTDGVSREHIVSEDDVVSWSQAPAQDKADMNSEQTNICLEVTLPTIYDQAITA